MISQRLNRHSNSLNFLRLMLAVCVIVSHARPIGGFADEWKPGGLTLGTLAVGGFFAISGYLITGSRFNSGMWPYLWRRLLRILPAYWVCLVVVALGISAAAGVLWGGWSFGPALRYVTSNADFVSGETLVGSTLEGAPFSEGWNGSLWTLRYELLCYLGVGVALLIPAVRKVRLIFPAAFLAVTAFSLVFGGQESGATGLGGSVSDLALLMPFFVAGAMLFRYESVIPLNWKLGALSIVLLAGVIVAGYGMTLSALPLAYLCLWAGASLPAPFKKIGKENDLSYGMYLYAFPVQQFLALAGAASLGLPLFTLLGIVLTVPFAAASWFLVERPALAFKSWPLRRKVAATTYSPTR